MIVVGILLTVIGLLLILAFLLSRIRCKTETEAVVAKIIEKKRFYRGRTITDYTPVFAYTVNNKEYHTKAEFSTTNTKKFFVGRKMTVFTDADHPENIRCGSNFGYCLAGIAFTLMGAFIIVLVFI